MRPVGQEGRRTARFLLNTCITRLYESLSTLLGITQTVEVLGLLAIEIGEMAMAAFKVLATNHTSFTVSDLDRTVGFFVDGLGFELISRAPRDVAIVSRITGVAGADIDVAYVQGPGHRLELIQYRAPDQRGRVRSLPCDMGFAHIAFDVDDIDAAIAASKPHGVVPIGAPVAIDKGPNKGGRVAYLRDPDDVTIEFNETPPQ